MSKIIGITGAFGSGKSTASEFFEKKGFKKFILSHFLEEEAKKRGFKKITRKILQDIGNELREKFGSDILAVYVLDIIEKEKLDKVVIDGLRNASEIETLRKTADFTLLAIKSDKENRFNRLKKIKRRESLTLDIFNQLDDRDRGVLQKKTGLHVDKCIEMADSVIENNQSATDFKNKLENYAK